MSGLDPLRDAARGSPDAPALDDGGRIWSYAELDAAADRLAALLRSAGCRTGTRVALLAHATGAAVRAVHAIPRTGAILAPLNPRLTVPELRRALSVLRPALVISDGHRALALEAAGPGGPDVLSLTDVDEPGTTESDPGAARSPPPHRPLAEDDVLAVIWTSGTTGSPRGVELTRGNFRASAAGASDRLGLGSGERWYASLEIAHVGGLALVHRAAATAACILARGRFDAAGLAGLIGSGGVTHASLVPSMVLQLLDLRPAPTLPASLRCVLVGGAGTPADLLQRSLAAGLPVALTYGMTEACSQVATAPPELVKRKPGTVGRPLAGTEIRIRDGGIEVRGPTVARRFLGQDAPVTGPEGWLATGDVGHLDEDGDLWVTGRRTDRIVSGGVNVDPTEVEAVLLGHPSVAEVAVVGREDRDWGERVVAVVVARAPLTRDELLDFARPRLAATKRPRELQVVPTLPRNANGKVDRTALRDWVSGRPDPERPPPPDESRASRG